MRSYGVGPGRGALDGHETTRGVSPRVQLKRELAGMSYQAQLERVRPGSTSVQMKGSAVQMAGGGTPVADWTASGDIDALIDSCGVHHQGRFPTGDKGQKILYRKKEDGSVTAYMVFDANGPVKRVDVDASSAAHGGVPPPHAVLFVENTNPAGQTFRREGDMPRPCAANEVTKRKH